MIVSHSELAIRPFGLFSIYRKTECCHGGTVPVGKKDRAPLFRAPAQSPSRPSLPDVCHVVPPDVRQRLNGRLCFPKRAARFPPSPFLPRSVGIRQDFPRQRSDRLKFVFS